MEAPPPPRRVIAAAIVVSLALAPAVAAAEDDGYREQVIAVDVGADILMASCLVKATKCWLFRPGAVLYLAGGPAVHLVHRDLESAGASFGMRAGLPFLAALLGAAIPTNRRDRHSLVGNTTGAMVGVVLGALGAQVLDVAFFAGPDEDPEGTPRMITLGGSF